MKTRCVILKLCIFLGAAAMAHASTMANSDVIKMVQAGLDEGIIVTAVENSESKFNTSSDGLIELTNAKVPQKIIAAVIKRAAGSGGASVAPEKPVAAVNEADQFKPSEVLMIDDHDTKVMKYLTPQMRTAVRGLGFGGVAQYSVLRGAGAGLRTTNKMPSFLIAIPEQAQAESYFTLASFAVRSNNTREVMIGGGFMSYSTGIHPDRIVLVKSTKAADQSRAPKGFSIYQITPVKPLGHGEYAVILYTGELHGLVSAWFSGFGNSYFDFGID